MIEPGKTGGIERLGSKRIKTETHPNAQNLLISRADKTIVVWQGSKVAAKLKESCIGFRVGLRLKDCATKHEYCVGRLFGRRHLHKLQVAKAWCCMPIKQRLSSQPCWFFAYANEAETNLAKLEPLIRGIFSVNFSKCNVHADNKNNSKNPARKREF